MNDKPIRIGIVVGETSGDMLGCGLVKAIRKQYPNATFEGIGGPLLKAEGCKSLFAMDELMVMGLVEVLGRLRRLLDVRKQLVEHFVANPPDLFIGIDAPDFNLGLETKLKAAGIKTVHYVSPSVWAWRKKRIFKIKAAADLVLCLLPFETGIYDEHNVKAEFVGHSLADEIPLTLDKAEARKTLGLDEDKPTLALLPGSRGTEINMLAEPFLQTAAQLKAQIPDLQIITPVVSDKRRDQFLAVKERVAPDLPVTLVQGKAREAMTAGDAILLASGTATLEAMLVKRPMLVAYKFKWLSYQIFSRIIKVDHFSLPNLLAKKALVPELLQDEVTPERMTPMMLEYLTGDNSTLIDEFTQLHQSIAKDASAHAAEAVIKLYEGKS